MSVLAAITSLLLLSGFTTAATVAPRHDSTLDWSWVRPIMDFSDVLSIAGRMSRHTTLETKIRAQSLRTWEQPAILVNVYRVRSSLAVSSLDSVFHRFNSAGIWVLCGPHARPRHGMLV